MLGIIGILAALSLPAMRGLGRANQVDSAAQQLADDLALARARAINGRTTVHVVFVPTNILSINAGPSTYAQSVKERLLDGPYRAYGFFADRSVGDQPGRPTPYYMDDWRALPEGVLLAPYEYVPAPPGNWQAIDPLTRPLGWISIPFPTVESGTNWVPHMSFGPEGGLVDEQGNRVFGVDYIELRKGSILSQRDAGGGLIYHDVRHDPTNNAPPIRIRVDGFTGKAQIERPEIQ